MGTEGESGPAITVPFEVRGKDHRTSLSCVCVGMHAHACVHTRACVLWCGKHVFVDISKPTFMSELMYLEASG